MKWKMAIVKTQELWYSVFNGLETLPETIPITVPNGRIRYRIQPAVPGRKGEQT